ncbi:small glutamine-rich tetratricopeptide repeat-containing protein beta isoform X4 [Camellia sinensis]|uniref:small glutamine-rich tetratricopeptide repeat-containing protein beta isoform X4 n=1 Tax=Camellia sinensis TaxID=4442 RepID=UPI001036E2EE|nr:small glutamine-rich tetratricopeptide repeat-containing protein beta isoform X4 [Camellia sinensis]
MASLKTDSPLCRRIVRSFLDFLNSVEPAPGVDLEGLEVAKECLAEVFKIDPSSVDSREKSDLLINLFNSWEANEKQEHKSDLTHEASLADAPSTSSAEIASDANHSEASQTLEMKKSGCQIFDVRNLAETFKSQGNRAMQSKLYCDAIELYTFAIALCADNAVYYCNRAAAYTQVHQYAEAVRDCLKSIEMKPSYSKAYSRLGFAYYAQGNYRDAIDEGFLKALELDPNNDSVKENIRVAEQKLEEEQRRSEHHQNSSSGSHQESNQQSAGEPRSHAMPPPFTSMPFNANGLPADIASMFRNMAGNAFQGQHPQHRQEADGNTDTVDEPEIRVSGNVNVNFGEQMPEELTGALRSVMEMFQGASSSSVNRQDNVNGRSAPS